MLPRSPIEYPSELVGSLSYRTTVSEELETRIRLLLLRGQQEIDSIDQEILLKWSTGSDSISRQLEFREMNVARMRVMRGAISPLKRIPAEILGKIFAHYTGGMIVLPPRPETNPWKLGHVSIVWRTVLWSTPEMWTNIMIHSPRGGVGVDRMEIFTNVRHTLNNILIMTNTPVSLQAEELNSTPIADLLMIWKERFRSLTLSPLPYRGFYTLFKIPFGSLDLLERLVVKIFHDETIPFPDCPTDILCAAPNLKHLAVTFLTPSPTQHVPQSLLLLPTPHMNYLAIFNARVPYGAAHQILSQCPLLVRCSLTIGHDSEPIIAPSVITLSYLEILEFVMDAQVDLAAFLAPFKFPSLKDVTMTPRPEPYVYQPAVVYPSPGIDLLVIRSNCRLDMIILGGDLRRNPNLPCIDPDIENLLQGSPTLTILVGSLILPPSVFLEMRGGFLPELRYIVTRLQVDGLLALLDLIDHRIHPDEAGGEMTYTGRLTHAVIWCLAGRGFRALYRRYEARSRLYCELGISLRIHAEPDVEDTESGSDVSNDNEGDELGPDIDGTGGGEIVEHENSSNTTGGGKGDETESGSVISSDGERDEPSQGIMWQYLNSIYNHLQ